ncbi:MAG: phosphoadenylyl-sulfate reductase [Pseudomonadota bacterium]
MSRIAPLLHSKPLADTATRVAGLTDWYRQQAPLVVLDHALRAPGSGRVALVSSFGAEAVVLLHMVSQIDRHTPVLFLDTEMLFPETLAYQHEIAVKFQLSDLRAIQARKEDLDQHDPDGELHKIATDACCALRKTRPLARALRDFDGWITGRKRFHGGARASLDIFEAEPGTGRIKINPLAHWRPEDVLSYVETHDLPRHPLVARGYPSIGCMPCTSPAKQDEDPRAGRWRGNKKTECGIHFDKGRATRTGASA